MISASDYAFLQTMLKTRSGLVLAADKGYLIESRLLPVARQFGCATIGDLVTRLRSPAGHAEVQSVVEAMTTNESFFFRDKLPFDAFQATVLPALLKRTPPGQVIRIWCAAASSGQEPYSLAMLLSENAAIVAGRRIEIIATDISQPILERARDGIYTQFEVQRGLPVQYLAKYFTKTGDRWQISPQIRSMVTYKYINLLESFLQLGVFDVVFCRNVLIYFDVETKRDVLDRMSMVMRPEAVLVLGGAETVLGLTASFQPLESQRCLFRVDRSAADRPARDTALSPQAGVWRLPSVAASG
jgi:chemotaxis protein methyltransferase CheR